MAKFGTYISDTLGDRLRAFADAMGMKIRCIVEAAIKEYLDKYERKS